MAYRSLQIDAKATIKSEVMLKITVETDMGRYSIAESKGYSPDLVHDALKLLVDAAKHDRINAAALHQLLDGGESTNND